MAADARLRQMTGLEIADYKSRDSRHFVSLDEQSRQFGTVTKTLADGAYDPEDDFSYLYRENIVPGIKTGKNSSVNTGCHPRRESFLAQLYDLDLWNLSVSYGDRWIAESVFLAFKRFFGEHVMAHKFCNMVNELELKVALYNLFASV